MNMECDVDPGEMDVHGTDVNNMTSNSEWEQVMSPGAVANSNDVPGVPSIGSMTLNVSSSAERLAALSPIKTIETVETIVSTNKVTTYEYVESPRMGMVFKTFADVESYYKQYAEQKGFGVTRVSSNFSKDGERRGSTWKCECWGPPDMRARREAKKRCKAMEVCGTGGAVNGEVVEDVMQRGKRTSKKCECGAMMYAGVDDDGLWVIRKLKNEHDNHAPNPSMSNLVKEYRMKHFTSNVRRKLQNYYEEGLPIRQIHGCMATETGFDNLPSVKDLQHEIYKTKKLKMEGGDAAAMMAYFDRMQADNQNLYHAHRLDEDGRLKDVMWVDARSRVAYQDFGDVVCFDATYLTNEYELPFANFVGVNHHGQSILMGCALVSHEDCDTYTWVFRQWLACMGNIQPGAILTDQAAAMRKPLAQVMPNARHRWCIWHILKKIPEKLGKCKHYADFKSPLKTLIYESFTVDEFENRWTTLIKQYKLEDNDWLSDLFEERHMWVPAFMKEYFWAGMKTTQRVESINSFFDGFVNKKTKLYEFPEKYTRAMQRRVRAENDADARCAKYVRCLISGFKVERLFQKIYTDTKFQEIQTECTRLMHCYGREERALDGGIIQYRLEDRVWIIPEGKSEEVITDRRRFYCVLFNTNTKDVSCDCRKFKTFGIICRHMILVFDQNLVFDIPSKYILDRWRKDVVRKHTRVKVAYHDPSKDVSVQTYNKLMHEFEPICEEASFVDDKETVDLVVKALQMLRLEVKKSRAKYLENQPSIPILPRTLPSEIGSNTMLQGNTPKSVTMPTEEVNATADLVKDPIRKKPRGRPKGSKNQRSNPILPKSSPVEIGTDTMNPGNTPNSETMPEVVNGIADVVKDPIPPKRPRGRPKGSRLKSLADLGYKKPQRKKTNAPQQQPNTIENYYEYVEDAGLVDDNHRDAVDWSDTF